MDPYHQPDALPFTQQHFTDPSPDFESQDFDSGDIVKSKPRSYMPLTNETNDSEGEGEGIMENPSRSYPSGSASGSLLPPNGSISLLTGSASLGHTSTTAAQGLSREPSLIEEKRKLDINNPALVDRECGRNDFDDDDIVDDSTKALLGEDNSQQRRSGGGTRPSFIHLSSTGGIGDSGELVEILMKGSKKCSVLLEEDRITWKFLTRKDSK